ncbi:MAG: stage II sporulation protein E [Ignavibacteriales bacterium]
MQDRPEIYPFQRVRKFRTYKSRLSWLRMPRIHVFSVGIPLRLQNVSQLISIEALLLWAAAFLMGRAFILGEILPFAAAFAAGFQSRERPYSWGITPFLMMGVMSVASGYLLWGNLVMILVLSLFMYYLPVMHRRQWWALPVLTMCIVIMTKTCFLLFNDLTMYREIVAIFEALTVGILTFVTLIAREVVDKRKDLSAFNIEDSAAFVILGYGLMMGMLGLEVYHLSLAGITCRLGILLAAYFWGVGGGTIVGAAGGLIPAVTSSAMPRILAIYTASGLLAGVFRFFGKTGIILGFVIGNLILSVFMTGQNQAIIWLAETVLAVLAFIFFPEKLRNKMPVVSMGSLSDQTQGDASGVHVKEWTAEKMNNLAKVFEEMSMTFADPDPQPDNGETFVGEVFQNIGTFCQKCSIYRTCWEQEFYQTYRSFFNLLSLADVKGQIDYEDMAGDFRRKCLKPRELCTAINGIVQSTRVNEYWEEKVGESRDLLSHQLLGVSGVIKNLAQEINLRTIVDQEMKTRLIQQCKEMGMPVRDITPVVGDNEQIFIKVVAEACMDRESCDSMIAPSISSLMGSRYEVSQRKCPRFGRGTCEFTLARSFKYRVTTGVAQLAKADVSGDSFNVATLRDGRELIVLSDGMGVGQLASHESRATVNLLEELFNTGFEQEVALKTVNSVLLLRNQRDSFATVDMALVDLYSGDVDFVKIGAVPSFLKRGKKVGVIAANSLPIGIVEDLEIPAERRSLLPGDMLVLISDGILDPRMREDQDLWLRRILADTSEQDPHRLAEILINKALEQARGKPRDDMTVICALIETIKS